MDVATGFVTYPLVIEFALLVIFIVTLFNRGTHEGRSVLIPASLVIVFFSVLSISNAMVLGVTPVGPPPPIWDEGYYDALFMRSLTYIKAVLDGIFLLVLSSSYTVKKLQETKPVIHENSL